MSAERYSHRVFADDVDETVRINQYPQPPVPSWSSMFFGFALVIRNILEDEEHGIRGGVPVDPPIRWYLEIGCTELCRDRGEFISNEVSKEARKIMFEMLEECMGGAVPSFTRRCIANDFGVQACWMLCDARYALCRKLPVIVELTVFSAFPVTSRLRLMPMAMEGLELSQLAAAGSAEDEMCAICLAELHAGSEVTRLPCSHYFHGECVLRWLRINRSCPLCRFILPH
ncbi:E3 ubiquitin-protein ligase Os06g0535400-like [Ananas comosus]|uniref:RING-type E3 ubiquitin transferase n=1 Tax=Ananas comosus TaxID=4615 RepID=A0A6P5FSR3_ANACO|nr:E3 ubiquitin-protein ligase Os06g0535400-like [Ananas comosus]